MDQSAHWSQTTLVSCFLSLCCSFLTCQVMINIASLQSRRVLYPEPCVPERYVSAAAPINTTQGRKLERHHTSAWDRTRTGGSSSSAEERLLLTALMSVRKVGEGWGCMGTQVLLLELRRDHHCWRCFPDCREAGEAAKGRVAAAVTLELYQKDH